MYLPQHVRQWLWLHVLKLICIIELLNVNRLDVESMVMVTEMHTIEVIQGEFTFLSLRNTMSQMFGLGLFTISKNPFDLKICVQIH